MQSRALNRKSAIALTVFSLLAMQNLLAAQNNKDDNHGHPHYKLVVINTFGRPHSYPFSEDARALSNGERIDSVRDSETIPSADSASEIDDLISARDHAEISSALGLTSDASANFSCPVQFCTSGYLRGPWCGCFRGYRGTWTNIYDGYDPKYKRHCRYYYNSTECGHPVGTTP